MVKRSLLFGIVTSAVLIAAGARADECNDRDTAGQRLRAAGKWMEAREAFRGCTVEACGRQARLCVDAITELDAKMPSVLLRARRPDGQDVVAVRVTESGRTVATTLDGRAVELDPGQHAFTFESEGFAPLKVTVLLAEGEKRHVVEAKLEPLAPPPSTAPTTSSTTAPTSPPSVVAPIATPPAEEGSRSSFMRPLGYAIGGAGLLALGLGAIFGVQASSKNEDSKRDCDASNFCGPEGRGLRDDAFSAATVSTVGFIAGGVLLAAGIALFVLSPRESAKPRAAWITPMYLRGAF